VGLCALSSEVGNAALKQTALSLFAKCNCGDTATEKKFFWVLWSFLISSVTENLNPVSLQRTADVFPEHVSQGSFMLFFNAESFFFNAENTLLLLLRIQRYMWWITMPHVGILRTMWSLNVGKSLPHLPYFHTFSVGSKRKESLRLAFHISIHLVPNLNVGKVFAPPSLFPCN